MKIRIASIVLVAAAVVAVAQDAPPDPARELAARCASGKLDGAFVAAFDARVEQDLLAAPGEAAWRRPFIDWLRAHPEMRDEALLATAQVGPKVASNLDLLRRDAEADVVSHSTLAIAFAAVWSRGDDREPRRHGVVPWLDKGRQIPTMLESFLWYVRHEKSMRMSMRDAPWPILAHLADSPVPLADREWALQRFGDKPARDLRDLTTYVPYRQPERGDDDPWTLPSFLTSGGICFHSVQFACGVLDSFGLPSGGSGGPGHIWPYWFEQGKDGLEFWRSNYLGNRTGTIREPTTTGDSIQEEDLRLLVEACNIGERRRFLAAAAAWAAEHLPADASADAVPALDAAVRTNPCCRETCLALARATGARRLPADVAGAAWRIVAAAQTHRPDCLLGFLETALPAAPARGAPAPQPTMDGEAALLDGLDAACEEAKRPDLAARARMLRGRCLESRGKRPEAAEAYRRAAADSAESGEGAFRDGLDAALRALDGDDSARSRRSLLERLVASSRPKSFDEWQDAQTSHQYAVQRLVEEMRAAGDSAAADKLWLRELFAWRGSKDDGTKPAARVLVGGKGGTDFADERPGASLVGVRTTLGKLEKWTIVRSIQPIYEIDGKEVLGAVHGKPEGETLAVRAKPGWVVGGFVGTGGGRLDGFSLLFVPRTPGADAFEFSPWHGGRTGGREILVGGPQVRAVGLRGRAADDVHSLGLVADAPR